MFNILRNATIRNATSCRSDSNEGLLVVWEENENFKQYEEFSGLTTRLVWDRNYFAVSTSGICYVGPTADFSPFDAGVYSKIKTTFRVEVPFGKVTPTTGRIQFQTTSDPVYDSAKAIDFPITPNNTYNEYTIDMALEKKWQGEITRIRLYPFIDGDSGLIIHLKEIRTTSAGLFRQVNPAAAAAAGLVHPCPSSGVGGSCEGVFVGDGIDIIEGINDRLVVNINGYGNLAVVLTPVSGGRLKNIARDIENKLSSVAIGGYSGNRVEDVLGKLKIIADDTREQESTVVVIDSPAARTLGFFDTSGTNISVLLEGEDPSPDYQPAGTIQLSKSQLAYLFLPDYNLGEGGLELDPRHYSVQGGRADYAVVYRDQKIDAINKTIIEFNNPVTNNGIITKVSYSGDATSETKFLFFRPKSDGTLTLYDSVDIQAGGIFVDAVFEQTTNVKVRKGDLLGIFDAKLDLAKTEERPNVSYFLYEGELSIGASISAPDIQGRGERGLHLFAHGSDKETEAVIDITFEQPELIEEIRVVAEETVREEEINLTRSRGGGINGGPFIEGSTGVDKFGAQAPALVNLGAVTDGINVPSIGADTLHPSWVDTIFSPDDLYDQTEFTVTLDFAKGIPVFFDINRVKLYFRDVNNIKFFSIEYPITTNSTDTDRNFGPVTSKYDKVTMGGLLLEPNDHPLYSNPNAVTVRDYPDSYQNLDYSTLDFVFQPVKARTIRYNVKNFFFEDDVNKETLSDYILAPSPHILEMEVFARSVPEASISDNFFFESSLDGEKYISHNIVREEGTTSARYLIGYPVPYLRLHIKPQGKIKLKKLDVILSEAKTKIITNAGSSFLALNSAKDDFQSVETITVTNSSSESFNYFVGIAEQRNPVQRCILWNKMGSVEELTTSEIGPAPYISKREPFFPREYNVAYETPSYESDPFWLLNKNAAAYISFDHGATWESRGTLLTDYNINTVIEGRSSNYPAFLFVYIVIDLGDVYGLDTVQIVRQTGLNIVAWDGPLYSNKNVSDPNQLNIIDDFTGVKEDARWLRLRAVARSLEEAVESVASASFIRASIDILRGTNKGKVSWVATPRLTNYIFGSSQANPCGEGWECAISGFNRYYAIDLEDSFELTNIITGPNFSSALATTIDLDALLPGGAGSLYSSSSTANSSIAYSSSKTAIPNKVSWGALGAEPGEQSRWVLIRSSGNHIDEVAVHINSNVNEDKPFFISERWWTAALGEVQKDKFNFTEGTHSITVDYSSNQGPAVEEIELVTSLGIDHNLAKRDQLRILLYVSDVSQLDLTQGHIAIGRNTTESNGGRTPLVGVEPDRENYFQWNFTDLDGLITTGWNELFLPFSDNFQVGQPNLTRDNFLILSASSASGHSRLRWFRVNFMGKESNESFSVSVSGIKIVRADFVPGKFGNSYYLAGNEYLKFPLTNFDPLSGSIEFYLNPDWTKGPNCNSCDDPKEHTIFRFFNEDGYVLGCFMTGEGIRLYLTDGTYHHYLTDNNSPFVIAAGVNTHIAVTWDLTGKNSDKALAFYVDNKLSSSFRVLDLNSAADFITNPNVTLLLGGLAWDGVITSLSSAVGGTIDNMRVYNYPIDDFSHSLDNQGMLHIRPSDDLITISVDNVSFFGNEDRAHGLPILVRNVQAGASFNIYVKHKDNGSSFPSKGQERNSYIEVIKAKAG